MLAAVGAAIAVAVSAGAAATKQVAAEWDVAGVGSGARSLDLYVNGGGCGGPLEATARETASTVTVTVLRTVSAEPDMICTADYKRDRARVSLAAPLNGRSIRGRPAKPRVRVSLRSSGGSSGFERMPRLRGMAPWEARRALRLRGLGVRIRYADGVRRRAQVISQAPAAGEDIRLGAKARLVIGRR